MQPLEEFETQIRSINVKDFGDFRRKSNNYLHRLAEKLTSKNSQPILRELKDLINDNPNWKMEPTRREILAKTQALRTLLSPGPSGQTRNP